MGDWNIAEVWEAVAEAQPNAPAQSQGDRRFIWAEFDQRADALAARLLALPGAAHQAKVAQYLYNAPEYLESVFAAWKAGLVPVNTNYRYTDDELVYLWDNADAVAVVFHGSFTETIDRIRSRVPRVEAWLWVDDASASCPSWAEPYEDVVAAGVPGRVAGPWGREGDDLYMLYTGGTTGAPKGTMWRQDDIFSLLNDASPIRYAPEATLADVVDQRRQQGPGFRTVPACPLMHGTGALISFGTLIGGGSIVLLGSRNFDAPELLDTVGTEAVNSIVIVGDTFARPMVAALDAEPDRFDLTSLGLIYSSGVMWSEPVKEALLAHHPMLLVDLLGSSEAIGMGTSLSAAGADAPATASFALGPSAVVIGDDNRLVQAGSGEVGRLGTRGRVPVGYYKDPERSAATFPVIDGVRYSVPGDYATVNADGSLHLLGRGSVCINTGGEKVFPEEVEEALKEHPSVVDAVAVGVADERFGEAVTAVVELAPGAILDEAALIAAVRSRLAGFKAPKRVLAIDTIGRAANAKVDYARLRAWATDSLGAVAE